MKKVVKLTENDLIRIVKRVINEQSKATPTTGGTINTEKDYIPHDDFISNGFKRKSYNYGNFVKYGYSSEDFYVSITLKNKGMFTIVVYAKNYNSNPNSKKIDNMVSSMGLDKTIIESNPQGPHRNWTGVGIKRNIDKNQIKDILTKFKTIKK